MNGNFQPQCTGKRKKRHEQKQCVYLEEWLEKSSQQAHIARPHYDGREDTNSSGYWPPPQPSRRLFAALSDPAVCRYSAVPMGYSLEPVLCQVYQPPPPCHPFQVQHCNYSGRCQRERPRKKNLVNHMPTPATASPADPGQEFASLPPAAQSRNIPEPAQRRFSDPGLGPAVVSSEEDNESDDAAASAVIDPNISEQIASLHSMMKTVLRDIQELRTELDTLKMQTTTWRNLSRSYEPGMLSELVREVRDAARIREDALMARVCNMISATDKLKWNNTSTQLPEPVSSPTALAQSSASREIEELKGQLKEALADTKRTEERLLKVEAQLQNLHLSDNLCTETDGILEGTSPISDSGRDRSIMQELQQLKSDKYKLRCELEEAVATRKTAEENAEKMERLVDVLRKRINGVVQEEKQQQSLQEVTLMEQSPSSLENTSESLASIGSSSTGRSSSLQSPQVTMSGPVTDL